MKTAVPFRALWIAVVLALTAVLASAQDVPATVPTTDETVASEPAPDEETDEETDGETQAAAADTQDEAGEDSQATDSEPAAAPNLDENMCVACHAADVWDENTKHLFVRAEDLANDIHWKKGILCQGCHGGNAETTDLRSAHAIEDGFRKIGKPADEPAFCGYCHSDPEKMKSVRSDRSPVDASSADF